MTLGESISELVVVQWRLFWKPKNKFMRQLYNPCWEKTINDPMRKPALKYKSS